MKFKKSVISMFLVCTLIFSAMGSASASAFHGGLSVGVSSTNVKVGDTVTIDVTALNDGITDWENVKIYIPIPAGLQFESFVVPDRNIKDYTSSTGVWNVIQMKWSGRGHEKEIIITTKVLPEAAGKTLPVTASFISLRSVASNGTSVDEVAIGKAPPAFHTPSIVVSGTYTPPKNDTKPTKDTSGDGPGLGSGSGSGIGSGSGSGIGSGSGSGIGSGNMTAANGNNLLTGGGGGNGKAYQVYKNPKKTQDPLAIYVIAILLIIGLLALGYFYGIKKE
jgi:uncharacterized repeat protein (TIGR01451 family)